MVGHNGSEEGEAEGNILPRVPEFFSGYNGFIREMRAQNSIFTF